MNKLDKNFDKFLSRMIATICVLPLLCAWVDPVDLQKDLSAEDTATCANGVSTGCNTATLADTTKFDRCDTSVSTYTDDSEDVPSACHRWNLIWAPIAEGNPLSLTQQSDWAPSLPNDENGKAWRLPTIKELARLINFTVPVSYVNENTLLESEVIKNWFTTDAYWDSNKTSINDGSKTVWLISSAYRDIDGVTDTDTGAVLANQAQVFAINIINGEIKTFEPGYEVDNGDGTFSYSLRLCQSLIDTGACTYGDAASNIIFALKVRTETVTKLQE